MNKNENPQYNQYFTSQEQLSPITQNLNQIKKLEKDLKNIQNKCNSENDLENFNQNSIKTENSLQVDGNELYMLQSGPMNNSKKQQIIKNQKNIINNSQNMLQRYKISQKFNQQNEQKQVQKQQLFSNILNMNSSNYDKNYDLNTETQDVLIFNTQSMKLSQRIKKKSTNLNIFQNNQNKKVSEKQQFQNLPNEITEKKQINDQIFQFHINSQRKIRRQQTPRQNNLKTLTSTTQNNLNNDSTPRKNSIFSQISKQSICDKNQRQSVDFQDNSSISNNKNIFQDCTNKKSKTERKKPYTLKKTCSENIAKNKSIDKKEKSKKQRQSIDMFQTSLNFFDQINNNIQQQQQKKKPMTQQSNNRQKTLQQHLSQSQQQFHKQFQSQIFNTIKQQKQQQNKQKQPLALPTPNISAQKWCVYHTQNNNFLHGKSSNSQCEIASLTKIMTCLVTVKFFQKYGIDLKKVTFEVSKFAASTIGTSARLKEGSRLTVYDLLYGLMLPSGNDAAVVLAEGIGTLLYFQEIEDIEKIKNVQDLDLEIQKCDIKKFQDDLIQNYKLQNIANIVEYLDQSQKINYFIKKMNKTSRSLGLQHSNFSVVHGLPNSNNVSNAKDIGLLSCFAMQESIIQNITSTQLHKCKGTYINGQEIDYQWKNTNKLIGNGYQGIKTGITETAGPCLASFFTYKIKSKENQSQQNSLNQSKQSSQSKSKQYLKTENNLAQNDDIAGEQEQIDTIQLVIIILNCRNQEIRWQETNQIKDWALQKFFHIKKENL